MLHQHAGRVAIDRRGQFLRRDRSLGRAHGHQLDPQVRQIRRQHLPILRMHAGGGHHAAVAAGGAGGHQHGFGRGAAAVVQAGVRDVHAGQLRDERLILEEDLQVSLAGLGLIGRVRGVKLAARADRVDDRGNEMVVAARAQEAHLLAGRLILGRQGRQVRGKLHLRQRRRNRQRTIESQVGRNGGEQFLDVCQPDRLEHRPLVFGRVCNVRHGVSLGSGNSQVAARMGTRPARGPHRTARRSRGGRTPGRRTLMPFLGALFFVVRIRQQVLQFRFVAQLDLYDPAGTIRIVV